MLDRLDTFAFGEPHEVGPVFEPPTLEHMLTSPEWFGLETATPMQRAICRIADGLPLGELANECERFAAEEGAAYAPDIRARMGLQWALAANDKPDEKTVELPETASEPPQIMGLVGGIRGGKTKLCAAGLMRMALRVDVSGLEQGETPRASCLSLDKDKAAAIFDEHLLPAIQRSPVMRPLLIGKPKSSATEKSLLVRHPSGRAIEIKVVAGKRAGAATISRWSAGVVFSEAGRMLGQDDAVVNLAEQEGAVLGRLLPGAQVWEESSPHAPMGPLYDHVQRSHGKPSAAVTVLRVAAPALNPFWWTPERCEAMRANPDAFATDVIGEFIEVLIALFGYGEVERILRGPEDLPRNDRCFYFGIIDPATRSNAWTLIIGALYPDGVRRVAAAREWTPKGGPLRPKKVWADIAAVCHAYGCTLVYGDQWAADHNRDMAHDVGLSFADEHTTQLMNVNSFDSLRLLAIREPVLVQVPAVEHMGDDLKRAQRKVAKNGNISISLPTTKDGRHCDFAPVVAKFAVLPLPAAAPAPVTAPEGKDVATWEDEQAALDAYKRTQDEGNANFDEVSFDG